MKKLIKKLSMLLSLLLLLSCTNTTEPTTESQTISSILIKSDTGQLSYYYTVQDTVLSDCITHEVDSINDYKHGQDWQFSTLRKGVGVSYSAYYNGVIVRVWTK